MEITKQNVNISDNELIESILDGEKKNFELLIRRYNPKLFRIGRSILMNEAETEDVIQETYIKVYENLSKFRHQSTFSTWVVRILINNCLTRKKAHQDYVHIENDFDNLYSNKVINSSDNSSDKNIINDELKVRLETAIDSLPELYRTVFIMREVEKMSVIETGECLAITESNVKVRLNRAKEMLRDSLLKNYDKVEVFEFLGERCDRIVKNVMEKLNKY